MGKVKTLLALVIVLPVPGMAASFTLGATIRAGTAAGLTEVSLGATSSAASVTGQMGPYWQEGVNYNFFLAYDGATNTANLTVSRGATQANVNWVVAGGTGNAARVWTVAAGGLTAVAEQNTATNTQVRVRNIAFTGPALPGVGTPNLVANQNGGGAVTASNVAPISFTTQNGQGSWMLDGEIRFTGLGQYTAGGAVGNQLRFGFDILSSDVPEPTTLLLGALGLAVLGVVRHYRSRVRAKVPAPVATAAQRAE